MKRIQPVDGLRSFAVLGVIWAHCWMFFGNLPLTIGKINVNQLVSMGRNGVDLFFVISGFCMYLMHSRNRAPFDLSSYWEFIKKRWLRIAPAFYFVVTIDSLIYLAHAGIFPAKSFIFHLFFVNTFNKDNVLSPPFWSLATEWHFYLVLPFLFIRDLSGSRLYLRILILMLLCMVLRLWLFHGYDLASGITVPSEMIWYRFVEFGFGILAARFYLDNRDVPALLKGNLGFILAFSIAFAGRVCMLTEFFVRFDRAAFIVRAFGEPIMTLGFALLVLNLVSSESIFKKIVTAPVFLFLGKISYSMYLWHWLIIVPVSYFLLARLGVSNLNLELTFVLSTLFTVAVSIVSYHYLEAPYFRKRTPAATPAMA